jgi:integrase/recombinase XerC
VNTELVPIQNAAPSPALASTDAATLIEAFLASLSKNTLKAYTTDLQDFAMYLGVATISEAASMFMAGGQGQANLAALKYRSDLEARGLAPATVRRRLAALKSMCKMARILGHISWKLEVQGPKVKPLRDTRGCGLQGYRLLLDAATMQKNRAKAVRDVAMLRLLGDRGLRRAEVTTLDVEDLDVDGERLAVTGKGDHGQKEWLTIAPETMTTIRKWLDTRSLLGSPGNGPLFISFDHRAKGKRITPAGLYDVMAKLGKTAGVERRNPHGLRHTSITAVLDITNGDVRSAQRFARHASPQTTVMYDDARSDIAGAAARLLAAKIG